MNDPVGAERTKEVIILRDSSHTVDEEQSSNRIAQQRHYQARGSDWSRVAPFVLSSNDTRCCSVRLCLPASGYGPSALGYFSASPTL